ncbi:MAG TPA: glucoamylase family protein [Terriglobales bacterium]|nr:glucoamylase family protein [Terriglobales bacterium]
MAKTPPLEIIRAEADSLPVEERDPTGQKLEEKASQLKAALHWRPDATICAVFTERTKALRRALKPLFSMAWPPSEPQHSDDYRWLSNHVRLLHSELRALESAKLQKLPHVRNPQQEIVPRVVSIAESYLEAVSYQFTEKTLVRFVEIVQTEFPLTLRELWALVPALKLVLLERIAQSAPDSLASPAAAFPPLGSSFRSLTSIGHSSWKGVLEPLILFDRILRMDPAGAYAHMDFDSRDLYRTELAKMAETSEASETEVAQAAVSLAEQARLAVYEDARVGLRESHVGFYLIDRGKKVLERRIGFRHTPGSKIQSWIRDHADEFFFPGIEFLAFSIFLIAALLLTPRSLPPGLLLISFLVLLLPCSQSAVQLMNDLISWLLTPSILPKLDFSEAIPDDRLTMVAVPALLLNENQVRALVEDLEVRFLGNHDPNIHFALLTDLPDSREPAREDNPLIDLCAKLIRDLNEKYRAGGSGSFFLFHRHRIYNPHERVWMGWERKRGKLLDLNRLLSGQYDSFPVKIGDLSVLPQVRYVITLDADTELPRGSARRMVGAISHPLNQAIIDPVKNVVSSGYGILQPRLGVSVQSTASSRLAALYAGETGFDIYTRAVSDPYQDLYGEGTFTGKGIYEVATVHKVLDRRFPRNALLSHDLIEGAYARAGLVSDIEVIEDYPSHYSAYNRRKHRWLRGDWQIAGWLFSRVPDESGATVPNPISLVSRWKILDNLRRSLVEPATFLLLLWGWLCGDSPAAWTLATVCILLLPPVCEFLFALIRSAVTRDSALALQAPETLSATVANLFLMLIFLAHQTLVSLDAVIRAFVRRTITRKGLLEWETAAEAERQTTTATAVDAYLSWVPVLALAIGALLWFVRPVALWSAVPILLLWACSKPVASWLNQPSVALGHEASRQDKRLLRHIALYTWRYFEEFSTAEHHWLIPDNVQEEPPYVAARLSPTNLGLLLNARQVACELGYLTVPEFIERTLRTMATMRKLRRHHGHFLNWYDTRTLQPLPPLFVSSVDSGNLLASLWTLQQGCLDRLRQPVVQPRLVDGLLDCLRVLAEARLFPRKRIHSCERERQTGAWLQVLRCIPPQAFDDAQRAAQDAHPELGWLVELARQRVAMITHTLRTYSPWSLPEFAALRDDPVLNLRLLDNLALEQLPDFIDDLARRLKREMDQGAPSASALYQALAQTLPDAQADVARLVGELRTAARTAGEFADEMDFSVLLDEHRRLLSVGFELEVDQPNSACYDLLATESRTAVFVAIAKEDIPQESWFLLGRAHTLDQGHPVLLSWTGTMFEYLMPSLWMRTHPNTLLQRSQAAVVRSQRTYASKRKVPWGISESAYAELNDASHYKYHAFGLPHLALRKPDFRSLVISPYSTLLALNIEPQESLANLQHMRDLGWLGAYGFYEAADYTSVRHRFWRRRPKLVRCWMAHHQGMSLLALANFLCDNVVQRWFHKDGRVQATELLLHEKPVAHVRRADLPRRTLAA